MPDGEDPETQIIPPLGSLIAPLNHLRRKIISGKCKPIESYQGGQLYSIGDTQNGYIVQYVEDQITYFVRY